MENINQFIDFEGIFEALFQESKEVLLESAYEASHYGNVLSFYDQKNEYRILLEECSLSNKEVEFVYLKSHNDANESNPRSTESSWYIRYNFVLDEFTDCDYECS
jgi:hypothetical protein